MHAISTTPLLTAALLMFWIGLSLRSFNRGAISFAALLTVLIWLTSLGAWGVGTARWATNGYYDSPEFLALLPGLWWPLAPTVITAGLLALPAFRSALYTVISEHSRAFVWAQALRVAAIGGVLKGMNGLLPPSFALPVGIPDFLFGLSALGLAAFWPKGGWSPRTLIIWNLIGMAVIMPAPVLMQMGLPGPLQLFTSAPDANALFDYPMVLAPTLIVPLFITMNGLHAAVLWLGAEQGQPAVPLARVGSRS